MTNELDRHGRAVSRTQVGQPADGRRRDDRRDSSSHLSPGSTSRSKCEVTAPDGITDHADLQHRDRAPRGRSPSRAARRRWYEPNLDGQPDGVGHPTGSSSLAWFHKLFTASLDEHHVQLQKGRVLASTLAALTSGTLIGITGFEFRPGDGDTSAPTAADLVLHVGNDPIRFGSTTVVTSDRQ